MHILKPEGLGAVGTARRPANRLVQYRQLGDRHRQFEQKKYYTGTHRAEQKTSSTDPFDGYTRSCHVKQQFVELQTTAADGSVKVRKVPTGLIDNSNEWLGDQMVRAHLKVTQNFDLTMQGFAEHIDSQMFCSSTSSSITDEMIQRRGSLDLAVAHMVCNLGGRVQFTGEPPGCWHQSYNRAPPNLPLTYSGDLKLEIIDLSGTAVMYEGLEMLPRLTHLKMLRLRRCIYLNDHCLSLVGQITQSPLEYLDISECPRITANGITTLTELKNLRRLLVQGNPTMKDRELVCLLLEDYLPKVYIEGVDYLGNLPEDARQRVLALDAPEKPPLLNEHVKNIEREEEEDALRATSE
ncbi:Distal membrane-arm assembly complex protein 2 [Taenia solium]|eukprot:TsM_000970000 transcript=TsM_000970000 gene=TsM_000970000